MDKSTKQLLEKVSKLQTSLKKCAKHTDTQRATIKELVEALEDANFWSGQGDFSSYKASDVEELAKSRVLCRTLLGKLKELGYAE